MSKVVKYRIHVVVVLFQNESLQLDSSSGIRLSSFIKMPKVYTLTADLNDARLLADTFKLCACAENGVLFRVPAASMCHQVSPLNGPCLQAASIHAAKRSTQLSVSEVRQLQLASGTCLVILHTCTCTYTCSAGDWNTIIYVVQSCLNQYQC